VSSERETPENGGNGRKRRVVVLFGGRSAEHEVSCTSAVWALQSLDQTKYDVTAIGITKSGQWVASENAQELLAQSAATGIHAFSRVSAEGRAVEQHDVLSVPEALVPERADDLLPVVVPVLHGPFGEDGTVQGLLELAGVPFVGSGVLSSAIAMDKVIAKTLFQSAGLPQADFRFRAVWDLASPGSMGEFETECRAAFGYPMFVKPANLGSSVGVSKVADPDGFAAGVLAAMDFDDWVIVEQGINGREIEFAVLGNEQPMISVPGEILPGSEFYDYDDKYLLDSSATQIPALLSEADAVEGQRLALLAYSTLRCEGLARVDFFFDDGTIRPDGRTPRGWLINEINTIPGCTPISMYPKLWEATGIAGPELLDRLIDHAIARFERRSGRVGRSRS
jgi:D-alanine-D-alanine ligase